MALEEGKPVQWGAVEGRHAVGGGITLDLYVITDVIVMLEGANVWVRGRKVEALYLLEFLAWVGEIGGFP